MTSTHVHRARHESVTEYLFDQLQAIGRMRIVSFAALLLLAASLTGCGDTESTADSRAVQEAWDEFKEASLSGKGETAANRVSKQTHEYYLGIRDHALYATREQILGMPLARQVAVLGMRIRVPTSELRSMSGRDLFIHAINRGWIGKNSASDEGITNIQITGDHARATATKAGIATAQDFHFIKEDDVWRLDMLQLMRVANIAFGAMQEASGVSEEEFVSRLIEAATSKRLAEADWNPQGVE